MNPKQTTTYCPRCENLLLTPAAIDRHNLRCAENGERSYTVTT